jgi:hypothetical protein
MATHQVGYLVGSLAKGLLNRFQKYLDRQRA